MPGEIVYIFMATNYLLCVQEYYFDWIFVSVKKLSVMQLSQYLNLEDILTWFIFFTSV